MKNTTRSLVLFLLVASLTAEIAGAADVSQMRPVGAARINITPD